MAPDVPLRSADRLLRNMSLAESVPAEGASDIGLIVPPPPGFDDEPQPPALPFTLRRLSKMTSLIGLRMEAVHICDFVDSAKEELETAVISENQWDLIEKTVRVLKPFEESTKELSKNSACASINIPAVRLLKAAVLNCKTNEIGTMADEINKRLGERFK